MELNANQQFAVNAGSGLWKVEAGPGSGKTRVVVERYKRLRAAGVSPNEIVSLTFTRSAADELHERTALKKERNRACRGGFRTFHSLALRILLEERAHLPFVLAPEIVPSNGQVKKLIEKLLRAFPTLTYREAKQYISLKKRQGAAPGEAVAAAADWETEQLAQVYCEYERRSRADGWLDFDSIMAEAVGLLWKDDAVRYRWQFKWVQVDEAQDCDAVQWELAILISGHYGNLFAVGDLNQALYSWRGANPETFANLGSILNWETIYLGQNYRATKSLVDFARSIAPIHSGLVDRLTTENERGTEPLLRDFVTDAEEALETAWNATALPGESAILARTNRQLRAVEDACLQVGTRYRLLGRSGFWQRPEVENLLAFARVVLNPLDDTAVGRVVLTPYRCARYLGKKFLEKLPRPYISGLRDIRNGWQGEAANRLYAILTEMRRRALEAKNVSDALTVILECSGMLDYYAAEEEPDDRADNSASDNVLEAVRVSGRFKTLQELVAHAERAKLAAESGHAKLTLGTVHAAKGREWENVFLIGVTENVLPHQKGDLAEEARIFYVGCTRAAKRLQISYWGTPSVFVSSLKTEALRGAA